MFVSGLSTPTLKQPGRVHTAPSQGDQKHRGPETEPPAGALQSRPVGRSIPPGTWARGHIVEPRPAAGQNDELRGSVAATLTLLLGTRALWSRASQALPAICLGGPQPLSTVTSRLSLSPQPRRRGHARGPTGTHVPTGGQRQLEVPGTFDILIFL